MTSHAEELARDAAARRAAQTEFDQPLIVEAGAGTGKTTTLVSRILVWCLGRGWEEARERLADDGNSSERDSIDDTDDRVAGGVLEGVTAITFTEAAAAEMAGRVARDLSTVASGRAGELAGVDGDLLPEPATAARRARALLGALDRLNVRTIHAFCRSLLARHPLEARLHPELEVDPDGSRVEEIVRELVERRSREAYESPSGHPLLELAALGYGPRALADALCELAVRAFPAQALERSPFDPRGVERMAARLARSLDAFERADAGALATVTGRTAKAPQVAALVGETRRLLAGLSTTGDPVAAASRLIDGLRAIWTEKALDSWLKSWQRGRYSGAEAAALGERTEALTEAVAGLRPLLRHYFGMDPRLLETARRCLAPLLGEAAASLRARGVVTFDALLREARDLLDQDADVLRTEQRRIHQLLVDEFQDTDGIQCRIVRRLALDRPAGETCGLFLVGDPKQTIFGWRNADLEAYEGLVAAAREAGGRRVSLLRNFRSIAPILEEVNRVIAPVMTERAGLQPRYEPLVPFDPSSASAPQDTPAVEYWFSWTRGEHGAQSPPSNTEAAELEARAIADDIATRGRADGGWGAFALLFRATTWQETYLEALRARGVPFRVTRDKSYYRRREIIDAAALVRTVVHPADQVALVTWLRSPTVGVPDAAWIPLWRHRFPEAMLELDGPSKHRLEPLAELVRTAAVEMPAGGPGLDRIAGWEENLVDSIEVLAELRRAWREEPVDLALRRLRERVLLDCTESARFLGAYRLANLDRFFRRLRDALEETGGDAQSVLRAIRRGVSEAWEAEEAMPQEAAEEAVQVSTIHAAKGLEFDHVYLVQTHGWSPGERPKPVDLDERSDGDEGTEYTVLGAATPGFDRVLERREAIACAERVRTLYVALTRAKRRLVIAGDWPSRPEAKPVEQAARHVDLLLHRWPEMEGGPGPRLATEPLVDEHRVLWRLVPSESAAAAPIPEAPPSANLPDADTVREERDGLAKERRSAIRRMAMPRVAAASLETGERLARRAEGALSDGGDDPRVVGAGVSAREAAMAAGDAIHRLFEDWDLGGDPERELASGRQRALDRVATLSPGPRELAARRVAELLDRFAGGELFRRFVGIGDRVLGREIPLLLRAGGNGVAARQPPLGAWSGAIDLLYRDSEGRPVVVDFKTDAVEPEEVATRAEAYALQEAVYRQAVRRAFGLSHPPEFELWFLWPDRLWTVS